jgi:hypothetical protein
MRTIVIAIKRMISLAAAFMILVLPLFAQDRLYPVRPDRNSSAILTEDHATVVVEKPFEYKVTVGFPSDDKLWFPQSGKLKMVVFWIRIENASDRPLDLNVNKFTAVDDQGTAYPLLTAEEVLRRVVEVNGVNVRLFDKTLKNGSLGRKGNRRSEDEFRHDAIGYSLKSGQIAPRAIQDGLIYFAMPEGKKYPLKLVLGDLWSQPLVFAKGKSK